MKRIQYRKAKGWKLPDGAVYTGRPTKYGNPFRLDPHGRIIYLSTQARGWMPWSITGGYHTQHVIDLYEQWIRGELSSEVDLPPIPDYKELAGKDLACWCDLDQPCHADVLLRLANQQSAKTRKREHKH